MLALLLAATVLVCQCLAAPTSDLEAAETKWHHGWHGGPGGPGGPGLYRGWGPGPFAGAWGGFPSGFGRFDAYGPGFFGDPLAAFSLRAFPGGVDPWGLGYSWGCLTRIERVKNPRLKSIEIGGFGPWYN